MNSTALTTKGVKLAVSALLAAAAFMALALAFSTNNAKASTVGGSVSPEFNYVGLFVDTSVAGAVDSLVLEPPADPIAINGTYTDTNGNFTVPQDTGLTFPPVVVDLDVLQINGEIGLTKDGTGNYNEATGAMTVNLSLSLTLGVDDLAALSEQVGIPLGTGALACTLAPLDVELATGGGWPHPGKAFTDKAALTDGALAGAWRYKPAITAVQGDQSVCNIIGGFLKPVGGIWLANSTDPVVTMPAATTTIPPVYTCEEDGLVGTPPNCEQPILECEPGFEGTPPNCTAIQTPANAVVTAPKKATVKAGKSVKVKVTIKNTGQKALTGKLVLSSSNKQVSASPKSSSVSVAGGKSITRTITVKASKKAKGKATITAKVGSKSAKVTVTVKK
jgi:hypothetical protein